MGIGARRQADAAAAARQSRRQPAAGAQRGERSFPARISGRLPSSS
ncbi:hypothetical protein M8494_30285 [Serratia ureilytica]